MEVRLSRAEYWLLEAVAKLTLPVHLLTVPNLNEVLNKPSHDLPAARILDVLSELSERGWVSITGNDALPRIENRADLDGIGTPGPTCQEWHYYQLTAAGGAVWEAFAAPQWDRFLDYSDDGITCELVGADQEWLQRYFDLMPQVGIKPISDSVQWHIDRPWQPTYWKDLPEGHRVTFRYESEERCKECEAYHLAMVISDWWYRWR